MNRLAAALACALALACACPAAAQNTAGSGVVQPVSPKRQLVLSGKIYNAAPMPVIAPYPGIVVKRFHDVGDVVDKDAPLLEIKLDAQLVLDLKRRLNINAAVRKSELEIAKIQLDLKDLTLRRDTLERLVRDGMAAERDLQITTDQIVIAEKSLDAARNSLAQVRADQAEQVKMLREQFGQPIHPPNVPPTILVHAPVAGTVLKVSPNAEEGLYVPPGELFTVGSMNPMLIRAQAFESDVARLKVGEEAEVTVESLGDRRLTARLDSISLTPTSAQFEAPSYYLLEFSVDNSDNSLREGYKVRITFR